MIKLKALALTPDLFSDNFQSIFDRRRHVEFIDVFRRVLGSHGVDMSRFWKFLGVFPRGGPSYLEDPTISETMFQRNPIQL